MQLRTLGHATLLLSRADGTALLATDPWLVGSAYWRSWWLEHYPSGDDIAAVAGARYLYITHEHPDHLHLPSLRRLGDGPLVLVPDFLKMGMDRHLAGLGLRVRRLPARRWVVLEDDLRVMSLPNWCNDSILLIDSGPALIVNLNDAKPGVRQLARLARLRRQAAKPCIVLRSYSPASPYNICFRQGERLVRGEKRSYARAAARAADAIGADLFLPFASQALFRRNDSGWANEYKVGRADLERHWFGTARLLPAFSTLDLVSGTVSSLDPADYDPRESPAMLARIRESEDDEETSPLEAESRDSLLRQLRQIRWPLAYLFPRGFSLACQGTILHFHRGRLAEVPAARGHFLLRVAAKPLKEALAYGHLGDLCIPMFARVDLHGDTRPRHVDVFFMLLILRDYGYLGGPAALLRWLFWVLRQNLGRLPDGRTPTRRR